MAINDLYCSITANLDHKLHCLGIFLDLSKAFDTLNHNILLHKLNIYGIRGLANTWIKSYLSDRKQYIIYDQKISSEGKIVCGVPQGSILGHYFSCFILMIFLSHHLAPILQFLPTTHLVLPQRPWTIRKSYNTELKKISSWFKLNKLSLNVDKTNFMIFKNKHSNKSDLNFKIKIDNKNIDKVEVTKFLGILII